MGGTGGEGEVGVVGFLTVQGIFIGRIEGREGGAKVTVEDHWLGEEDKGGGEGGDEEGEVGGVPL